MLYITNNTQFSQGEYIQDCSIPTTTQGIGSANIGIFMVFNSPQNPLVCPNDPFHILRLIDSEAC